MSTPAVEEYLELLYRLDAADEPARHAEIARGLGVSTAAVAEMLPRLESDHLVIREDGRTVRLTATGVSVGRAQVRKHRLAERLLHGILKRPWDVVHDEACRFEHVMTDELTESLVEALGDPTTCPHGNPIPPHDDGNDAALADRREAPLAGCRAGQSAVVSRIVDEKRDILSYMLSLGLLPGIELDVEQVAPFGGPLLIRVGEARYAIGRDVAERIRVIPVEVRADSPVADHALAAR